MYKKDYLGIIIHVYHSIYHQLNRNYSKQTFTCLMFPYTAVCVSTSSSETTDDEPLDRYEYQESIEAQDTNKTRSAFVIGIDKRQATST